MLEQVSDCRVSYHSQFQRRTQAQRELKGGSSPHLTPRSNGGIPLAFWRPLKWGGLNDPRVQIQWLRKIRAIFGILGKTAKRSHFRPPRPPESDSRPRFCTKRTENQLLRSILEPFGEDFVPNQTKSGPFNLGEPGHGFWGTWAWILTFFQLRNLDFQGSKRPRKRHFWIAELRSFKMC